MAEKLPYRYALMTSRATTIDLYRTFSEAMQAAERYEAATGRIRWTSIRDLYWKGPA